MTVAANPAPATAGAVGRHDDGKTLLFVGSFGYEPNVDGLVWFADAVWPSILAARPDTRLRIVGRGLSAQLATRLQRPGIDMVAPFGSVLHVCGRDQAALDAATESERADPHFRWRRVEPSLEDVFIDLMSRSRDNFGDGFQ